MPFDDVIYSEQWASSDPAIVLEDKEAHCEPTGAALYQNVVPGRDMDTNRRPQGHKDGHSVAANKGHKGERPSTDNGSDGGTYEVLQENVYMNQSRV